MKRFVFALVLITAFSAVDDVANTLNVDMTYSGLTTPTTNAMFSAVTPPVERAGVIIPFVPLCAPNGYSPVGSSLHFAKRQLICGSRRYTRLGE